MEVPHHTSEHQLRDMIVEEIGHLRDDFQIRIGTKYIDYHNERQPTRVLVTLSIMSPKLGYFYIPDLPANKRQKTETNIQPRKQEKEEFGKSHSIVDFEVLQTLLLSNIVSWLGNTSLVEFSLINKKCHDNLFEVINNWVLFEWCPQKHITHYFPKQLLVSQRVDRRSSHFPPLTIDNSANLPSRATHLTFGYSFNQPLGRLPLAITHLTLGYKFDQSLDYLPPTITHLTFGGSFNQRVDNLPPSITHLTTRGYFNQPVNNLPPFLTHLSLRGIFNQPVEHLPPSIIHLTFGFGFHQIIEHLPPNLTCITFGWGYHQSILHFPSSIIVRKKSGQFCKYLAKGQQEDHL